MTAPAERARGADPVLVHDYLLVSRGAERSFAAIAACWPAAPVATLLYDPGVTQSLLSGHRVSASPLQRLGVGQGGFRALLPLYPAAASRLPVSGHDLVISSSSAFAHGVHPDEGAVHVCYCYTPFRYAWHERKRAAAELPAIARPALNATLAAVRRWDLTASTRVTDYIAISQLTRKRIQETYGRDSQVIYPPVDTERFTQAEPEDFFLVVTELVPHKRTDVALEAAKRAGKPIKVVGTGPDLSRLKALYGDHAEFLGRIPDADLALLYPRALALVVPNVEEFGIAAVEAQAAGRPVIAPDAGGTRETVADGETGVLLRTSSAGEIADAMTSIDFKRYDPQRILTQAARYSTATFQERFKGAVARALDQGA